MNVQRWALMLAILATSTALSLSVLAGWQRGGTLPERLTWIAIGVVLVISAHLLPALIRGVSVPARIVGSLLWAACLAAACYGHAEFFAFAQLHAGEQRAATVASAPTVTGGRSLVTVMEERAAVTAQLAAANARYCAGNCVTLDGRRATLAAKIEALDAEADSIRRQQVAMDQTVSRRDMLLVDPITSRLAALLGTTNARIDLLTSLAFAAVLEGVACVLWTTTIRPSVSHSLSANQGDANSVVMATDLNQSGASVTSVASARETVSSNDAPPPIQPAALSPHVESTNDTLVQLRRDIAAGLLRPTVADIRIHLACSQARALALRRELAQHNLTT
ncbi:hypothetical protein [Burkholderia sp. 3C]